MRSYNLRVPYRPESLDSLRQIVGRMEFAIVGGSPVLPLSLVWEFADREDFEQARAALDAAGCVTFGFVAYRGINAAA